MKNLCRCYPWYFQWKLNFFLIITIYIPNMVPNMAVPMVIIPMVVISMSSLAKEEKILVTSITGIFKEFIILITCFAGFYNFVKHLNR